MVRWGSSQKAPLTASAGSVEEIPAQPAPPGKARFTSSEVDIK